MQRIIGGLVCFVGVLVSTNLAISYVERADRQRREQLQEFVEREQKMEREIAGARARTYTLEQYLERED